MEEKYTKFCKTFHKKLKNDKNLILCSNSLSDGRINSLGGIIPAFEFEVSMWSPNLWIPPYSQYQQRIFQVILKSRKQGKTFKDIAYDLNRSGVSSTRGSQFTSPLVHALLKKGLKRKERLETEVQWQLTPLGMSFLRIT